MPEVAEIDTHFVDAYVGQKVRERRRELKMSQQGLASALDLTFQQVQKYELGKNRISASKLFGISETLNVPIDYFFDGLPGFETVPGHSAQRRATAWTCPEKVESELLKFARSLIHDGQEEDIRRPWSACGRDARIPC